MRTTRGAIAALLALLGVVALVAGASPAHADSNVFGSGDYVTAGVPNSNNMVVAFSCSAVAHAAVVETRVVSCTLRQDGVPVATAPAASAPGPVAATASTVTLPYGPLEVCWEVEADFVGGATVSDAGCGTLVTRPPLPYNLEYPI